MWWPVSHSSLLGPDRFMLAASDGHDQPVAHPSADRPGCLGVTRPLAPGDHRLDPAAPEPLVGANASATEGRSRRQRASVTASSNAIEAPWPDAGDAAWTASPTRTMPSRCQVRTVGMS